MQGKRIEIIPRERLLALLDGGPALTVLRAPAGYGKSVLLDQWHARSRAGGIAACRIALTGDDTDPACFQERLAEALGLEGTASRRDLLAALRAPGEIRLLVDDADHLLAAPQTGALILRFLAEVPGLRLAIASRGETGLPLAKFGAGGDLLRLGANMLRFDQQEQLRLIEHNAEAHLSGSQIEALNHSFRGWPSGYSLELQSLHGPHGSAAALPSLRGSWRVLTAYFREEGFDAMPADLQDFLEQVSVLERLETAMCDKLLGISGSDAMLDRAYALGAHVWPIDPEHTTYEMLPLYAEFLRTRLGPARSGELRRRACDLLEAQEDYRAAAGQALALGDHERAGAFLEHQIRIDFASRDEGPVLDLANAIDPAVRAHYPLILLTLGMRLIFSFHFEQARKYLDQARKVIEGGTPCETDRQTLEMLLLHREMLLALGLHDMTQAQAHGDRLLRNMDLIPPMQRVMILNSLTQAQLELYIFRGAERFYVQAKSLIPELDSWVSSIPLETFYARYLFMTGRTAAAVDLLESTLGHLIEETGPKPLLGSIAAIALAEMKLELGDLDEARRLLADYGENLEHFGFISLILAGRISQARLLIAGGEAEKGLAMLEHTPVSAGELFDRVNRALAVERIDWLLRLGRDQAAKHACHAIGMSLSRPPEPETCAGTGEEAYAAAWVRLARSHNRIDEALHVARKWQRYTEGVGAIKSNVRWNVLIAGLLTLAGDKTQSMRALRRAVSMGAPGQYRQSFLSEIDLLRDQLGTLLRGDLEEPEAEFLRSILPDAEQDARPPAAQDMPVKLVGAFTSRENAILRLVARGMTNREIGNALGMTEGTVKWYLHRIYDKLGIRRRSQIAMLVAQWNLGASQPQESLEAAE